MKNHKSPHPSGGLLTPLKGLINAIPPRRRASGYHGRWGDKYLVFALLFALLNMGAIFLFFGFQEYGDSHLYFNVIQWLGGAKDVVVTPERAALRPLGSILALPFEFLGIGAGLIIQNIIFYLLSAFLIFKITDLIFDNPSTGLGVKKLAFLASVFFVTATPVIESGLSYLTDMGAWFFYILSIFLTLLYFKTKQEKLIVINGFLSGMGVLMKENGGLGILFFSLMILFSKGFVSRKLLKILLFTAFFFIPIGISQFFSYQYFHYTSLDWYLQPQNKPGLGGEDLFLVLIKYLGQLFRILGILWVFVFLGLWQELRKINPERIKIYLALIPASFSFLLWSISASARSVFIFAPLGILLAAYGCRKIKPAFLVLIVIAILVLNYWFVLVNKTIPFTDIIYNVIIKSWR